MYRQSEKNLLSSSNSSTCPHNMVNFGPLAAEICWRVWGTPANFNGFHVLVALLQRRRSAEASQTLHDVWPCSALLHIPGGSCPPDRILPGAKFTLRPSLEQRASAKLCGVVQGMELPNFRKRRYLYSAGRPSRWASAHFLVHLYFFLISAFITDVLFHFLFQLCVH